MGIGTISGLVSGAIVAVFTFRLFFKTKTDVLSTIKYALQPNIISVIKGEHEKDVNYEFTLWMWVALAVFSGCGIGILVDAIIG